jgi:hypothetical protein
MGEIRAISDDIVADDRRASSVILHLRSMMLNGEASQEILDLNEAVRQTVALARAEMMARRAEVEVQDEWASVRVKANLVSFAGGTRSGWRKPVGLQRSSEARRALQPRLLQRAMPWNGPGPARAIKVIATIS